MKATARKLLALIMAMAMCLSLLQGVAFAAESSEAEAEAEVVDVVETKEEKKEVKEQATEQVTAFVLDGEVGKSTGFKITRGGETTTYKWSDADVAGLFTIALTTNKASLGQKGSSVYTATLDSSVNSSSLPAVTDTIYSDAIAPSAVSWSEVTEFTKRTSSTTQITMKGSSYVESATGKIFFKLLKANSLGTGFEDGADATDWLYAVGTGTDAKTVLFATTGTSFVTFDSSNIAILGSSLDSTVQIATVKEPDATVTTYTSVITGIDPTAAVSTTTTTGTYDKAITIAADGKFSIQLTQSKKTGSDPAVVTKVTDKALVTKCLNEMTTGGTYTSIEQGVSDNTYWNVEFKVDGSVAPASDKVAGTNTELLPYVTVAQGKNYFIDKAALKDTSKAGDFTNSTGSLDTLAKDTILWGPVIVTSVPEDVFLKDGTAVAAGDAFASVTELEKALMTVNDKDDQTVAYAQIALNETIDGTVNDAYAVMKTATNELTYKSQAATLWDAANKKVKTGVKTQAGSVKVDKADDHYWVKKDATKSKTCQEDGATGYEIVCAYHPDVVDTDRSTKKTDPKDTSKPLQTIEALDYMFPAQISKENYDKLEAAVQAYYTVNSSDPTKYDLTGTLTGHYIQKIEKTNIVPSTKETPGSYTVKCYCQYGCLHDDLTHVVKQDATAAQHSGNWDDAVWTVVNPSNASNPGKLFGIVPTLFDTDVDDPALMVNKTGEYFVWSTTGEVNTTYDAAKNVYTANAMAPVVGIDVYTKAADGTKSSKSMSYVAQATITNIKMGEKDCQDSTATLSLNVYKGTTPADIKDANLVKSNTKEYTIPATKAHTVVTEAITEDGKNYLVDKCSVCGTEISRMEIVTPTEKKISDCTITVSKLTWTGKKAQPKVTVTDKTGAKLAKGIDYEVEDFEETAAGKYELVIAGLSSWTGRTTAEVEIAKASQTIKATPATKTVTAKSVKKKAATFTIKVTGKKNGAKLTYKSSNTKIATVSAAGKVTIKKGAKKGKAVITVQAKATKNVKASKAVKVTVTVK